MKRDLSAFQKYKGFLVVISVFGIFGAIGGIIIAVYERDLTMGLAAVAFLLAMILLCYYRYLSEPGGH